MSKSDDVKALVLAAVKLAGKKAFLETNEYISKRLVPGQYHLYSSLGSVSAVEIRAHIDDRIENSTVNNKLSSLIKDGVLLSKRKGRCNLYWLAKTDYLTDS